VRSKYDLKVRRLVYYGTDPVYHEIAFADRNDIARRTIDQHDDFITYGENIGNPNCPIPALMRVRSRPANRSCWIFWSPDKARVY
jgi:hypothetical protein